MLGVDKTALQAQVREVQASRKYMAELTTQYFEAKKKLEQTPEWLEVERITALTRPQSTQVSQQEEALRSMALVAYRESGSTKPVEGVTVKLFTEVESDEAEAETWSKINLPSAFMFNHRFFEKIAVNIPGAPITVRKVPRVQIATDLSRAVTE